MKVMNWTPLAMAVAGGADVSIQSKNNNHFIFHQY
jgi:hypothetical protein